MTWRGFALLGLIQGAVAACSPDEPADTHCDDPVIGLFLVSTLKLGAADPAGDPAIVPGTNLDGRISTDEDARGCFHQDFTSPPPDVERGVDNQLGPVAAGLGSSYPIDDDWRQAIAAGNLLMLLRIRGVETAVCVEVLAGLVPVGASLALDEAGVPTAGQRIDIDSRSAGSGDGATQHSRTGLLSGDRVRAEGIRNLVLPVFNADDRADFLMRSAEVRADVRPDGLRNGIISGALDVRDTARIFVDLFRIGDSWLTRGILEGQADLSPDEWGACQRISLGLTFDAVPVVEGVMR